jgi:pilus assembly protein CpaE
MNLLLLAVIGIALILVVILVIAVFLVLRPRDEAADKTQEAQQKPKKSTAKALSKPKTPEPAEQTSTNNKATPPAQATISHAVANTGAPTPPPVLSEQGTGEKIRILVVDDNPGTRDNVSRLLYFEEDMEVIGQAINGQQGIEMAVEMKPHIVLMDINMPDMDGITATKEMSLQVPYSQVVIMSVQSDQHYMKQAMAAGARDFQPKPFTSDELVSCLRRVYNIGVPMYRQYEALKHAKATQQAQQAQAAAENKLGSPIIAIYSPKGGVGASALAVNLAVAFQQQVGNTVLMDGAFQFGDILVHLNTKPARTISDLIHENELEVDLLHDVVLAHDSGLKLLLAPPQPQLADFITEPIIKEVLQSLKRSFNAVIVDTTPHITDRTLAILETADYILVVGIPELPSIKSIKLFLEVAEQLDFNREHIHVIINRFNQPGGIRPEKIEEVLKLPETFRVPYDVKLHFALNKGTAVCQHDPGAPSSQAIAKIARQMWHILSESVPEAVAA